MSIKTDCKKIFSLELIEFIILGIFAKSGETLRKDILLASLSDKQTTRKIERLAKNGFLREMESVPYHNMKGKNLKTFGLTLKGFFASFVKTNLQDNYLIKKYLSHIKDDELKQSFLNYIESDIRLFSLTNKTMEITIEKMQHIELWIEDYDNLEKFLKKDTEGLTRLKEIMDDAENNILSKIIPFENKLEYLLVANYDRWYDVIDLFSKEKSIVKIINELEMMNKTSSDKEFDNIGKNQFTNETKNKKIMYELFRGWKNIKNK